MKHSADSGWELDGSSLTAAITQASSVRFRIPDSVRLLHIFGRDLTAVLDDFYTQESWLIQLVDWKLGTSEFEQVGWKTVELMRRGYGELRPLEAACAQVFRFDERIEIRAFLLQILVNQWGAVIVPDPLTYFIEVEEEFLSFRLHDPQVAFYVSEKMARWNPTSS